MANLRMGQAGMRKLSERALRAFERYKDEHPAVAVYATSLVPAANAYNDAFDGMRNFEALRSKQLLEGEGGIRELYKQIRIWSGSVARDLPGFDTGQLIGTPQHPDHVLGDGKRLVELVAQHRESLSYADALLDSVSKALAVAQKEWGEATDLDAQRQTLQAELRDTAAALNRQLVAFRSALRELIGPHHRDYRMLRSQRPASGAVEEDVPASEEGVDALTTVDGFPAPSNGHSLVRAQVANG